MPYSGRDAVYKLESGVTTMEMAWMEVISILLKHL